MKNRIFFIVLAVVAGVVIVFVVQSGKSKTFSVRNEDESVEISSDAPSEASTSPVSSEQFSENTASVVESEVVADTLPESKGAVQVAPKKEDSKTSNEQKESETKLSVRDRLVNFGFAVPRRPRTIDTIILHSSYDALGDDPYSISGIIKEYGDAGVAAHYLIGRNGTIYRLVKEENVAYHAGVSKVPDGRTDVNGFSIGIEMVNTLEGKFTDEQYAAVKRLIKDIKSRRVIKYVLGHDDIAPDRKTDPWNFDWKRL